MIYFAHQLASLIGTMAFGWLIIMLPGAAILWLVDRVDKRLTRALYIRRIRRNREIRRIHRGLPAS